MSSKLSLPPVARAVPHEAAAVDSIPAAFAEQFSELSGLVRYSQHLYASPLGPFYHQAGHLPLPRFVYFGNDTADDSPRLAFLAGFDHRDLRSTHAVFHLIRLLALQPQLGFGLQLSFFPLVDVLGLSGHRPERHLVRADWRLPEAPELDLLSQDARAHGYHGFIRIESSHDEDAIAVEVRGLDLIADGNDNDLLSSVDLEPFNVRWETRPAQAATTGPLSLGAELPLRAFELVLHIPHAWSPELYREATARFFKRFIRRYAAYLAHAQHL